MTGADGFLQESFVDFKKIRLSAGEKDPAPGVSTVFGYARKKGKGVRPVSRLRLFRRQTTQALRSQAGRAEGDLRRQTNLAADANRAAGKALQKGEQTARDRWKDRSRRNGVPRAEETVAGRSGPAVRLPDGYERRSPVQPVYEAPDYRRRLFFRAVWAVIAAALVLFLLNYLLHSRLSVW